MVAGDHALSTVSKCRFFLYAFFILKKKIFENILKRYFLFIIF
jgi:hypothetical protein